MTDRLRIIFAGTPEFSVPALRALLASEHTLVAIYTQPDRPAGRGRRPRASPVKELALENAIRVLQPASFRNARDLETLEELDADLMIVVAYGLLLPKRVLEAPRLGCVNVHASLLPRWRGAAPIQRALLSGDARTGVTIMQLDAGLDTGPMLYRLSCPIGPEDTGGSLHDKLAALGARALMEALPGIQAGTLTPRKQDDALASYAPKLAKAEARLDWTGPAKDLERRVRAFNPWPVAHTLHDGESMRIWAAEARPGGAQVALPGAVLSAGRDGIDVQAGDGVLRITRLQMPGKRVMDAGEFLNAHELEGAVFD